MAKTGKMTLAEFLALPETEPGSELIGGEVLQKPMPTLAHTIIQHLLSLVIGLYLRSNPIAIAGPELRCIFGPPGREEPRLPDFVAIAIARLAGAFGNDPFHGAPDLAVEILSPDDRVIRVMEKVRFYLENGVRLVWVIDPDARTVMVFSTLTESRILSEDDTLDGGDVLPGFSTPVREILPSADLLRR
jgi:Uma2 family endonuclease